MNSRMPRAAREVAHGPLAGSTGGYRYQPGFGNEFASEAVAGALPAGRNSPQRAPLGLYAEQISGTAFTQPRAVQYPATGRLSGRGPGAQVHLVQLPELN